MRFITYNILTPFLCNSSDYIDYPVEHLDRVRRKNKILSLIGEWVSADDQPIISLQEVPFNWKGEIERQFYSRNYRFFCMNYGSKKNGFFGVAIGIPQSYKIHKVEYLLIGDHIVHNNVQNILAYVEEEKRNKKLSLLGKITSIIEEIVTEEDELKNIHDILLEAKSRQNFAIRIFLQKESTSRKFAIYNYHMPCTFKKPVIQILHMDAIKRLMYDHREVPTILMADLNITPQSNAYRYMTEGELEDGKVYLDWKEHSYFRMESIYRKKNGAEPLFTCYCHTKYGGEFKDTIDYVMATDHFMVVECDRLLLTSTKIPNDVCPSDHIPLGATLELV